MRAVSLCVRHSDLLRLQLNLFPQLSVCNLVVRRHNVSACFCDIWHSLSKWQMRVCPSFSSVWSGVHWGGVAERVEWTVEASLQWAENTLQHQRHQWVRSGSYNAGTVNSTHSHTHDFIHEQTTVLTIRTEWLALIFNRLLVIASIISMG